MSDSYNNPDLSQMRSTGTGETRKRRRTRTFTPNHLVWELFTLLLYYVPGIIGILFVLVFLVHFPMGPKANPAFTPIGIAPEWYFLAMFQVLKLMPALPAVSCIVVYLMVVMFLPFIDFSKTRVGQTRFLKVIGWINIFIIVFLTFWGGHWLEHYIYPLLKMKSLGP